MIEVLRKKTRPQLRELMSVSENLADQNYQRYRDWSRPFNDYNARAALLAFKGEVYTGFDLDQYGKEDFQFAQKHLRILSGLYGILRPLDLIQPYRLEMGTSLKTKKGKDLYTYWDTQLKDSVESAMKKTGSEVVINLASNEYFDAVKPKHLNGRIITPHFKDKKDGTYRFITFYGKKARGMMCDFMIRNRITDPEELKTFDREGYLFNSTMSEGDKWVFTRDNPPSAQT